MIQTIVDPILGKVTFDDQAPIHTSSKSHIYDLNVTSFPGKYCIKLYNSTPKIKLSMNAYKSFETNGIKIIKVYSMGVYTIKTDMYTLTADYVIMEKMQNILNYDSPIPNKISGIKELVNTVVRLKILGFTHTHPMLNNIGTNDFVEYRIIETDSIDVYCKNQNDRAFECIMSAMFMINKAYILLRPFISNVEDLQTYFKDPIKFIEGMKTAEFNKDRVLPYTGYFSNIFNYKSPIPSDNIMAQKYVNEFKKKIPNIDLVEFVKSHPTYIPLSNEMKTELQMLWQ